MEEKNAWSYTYTPLYVSMLLCLVKQKDYNFILTLLEEIK
jgi:hypothetical protein